MNMANQSLVNPGYCIVQQPGTLDFQTRLLFNDPNSDAARYFMKVNSDNDNCNKCIFINKKYIS